MLSVIDVDAPSAQNQIFCLMNAAKIADLEVDSSGFDFNWYDSATSTTILLEDELLIHGEDYYVSEVDSNGCESMRTPITVSLLALNDPSCDDCIINDGISDNDDNELAQDDLDELLGITNDEISDIEEKTENEARNLFRTNERLVRLGLEKVENLDDLPDELEDVDPFLEEAANITYDVLSVGKYAINSDKN